MSGETLEFQAEARQLLQLMVHSIYSNKDVFLRELISNASDALDKLRLASMRDKDLDVDTSDLHIAIEVDQDARTLTVRDNGIGMTRDEVVQVIGTIAKSGTAELLRKLRETTDAETSQELIGQFGVGFYAAFMVADRVVLVTRQAGEADGTHWESSGEGTYTIAPATDVPQGTAVTLHLKPVDSEDNLHDYAAEWTIRQIVKRYSDFIAHPIRMAVERPGSDDSEPTTEVQTLNSMKALWARPRDEVEPAEYHEFYKHVSHDWADPLEVVHMRGEGTFEYEALLFLPTHAPLDLFSPQGRRGVQLYVKRVFIMDDCEALMPGYLRFVKGVVDAHDLSLNISRELLQQDRQIQVVRRRLVKKVLATVKDLKANQPEKYRTFWTEFGAVVKEGLIDDTENRDSLLEILSVASTHDPAEPTDLTGYVNRMKDGQSEIYYATGENRTTIENSPHMEAFRAKGFEVLLLTDPVDEVWVERVGEYDGKTLRSVAKGQVDLDTDEERSAAEAERERQRTEYADLLTWLGSALADQVREVRLSARLTTSPACVVGDAHDVTPTLEKMYRAMGHEVPQVKRILELNPTHPLVSGLRKAREQGATEDSLTETAELLYGMALLAEGGELADPSRFTRILAERLARTL
ncbi:molecular chaperone HtpG [Salinispora arenicola]|uniref:Chaperone protein HtpG n=1 Tax=Salinispora arenicola (strain CNS-205) TaxID=391037 RepID=HTPG_SALAI|nr:molecular chaperone HtpG [Salinispora arenicola]A8M4S6.1 RecName: Full=Chaperone protein HtpG; AltName: Full=Heat shock protein HtpG; AltName: Full=High temperature protein G [Salinispora arenicola CNS-205]MCN0179145.1 molecular chaperone HtpG [Salinispora arenicola]NIL42230.1 molecular chaperone HtpG [Salinispora arenicola]NIL58541.1 molecular chaperone HtpG [Salinispora arenicola]NIL60927.1 molecular chaperone HtpG [Salinispora arenicola]